MIKELNIPPSEWQVGKNKVFLRSVVHEPLEDARKQMISSKAIIIQKIWRRYQQQQRYKKLRKAVLLIQHAYNGWKLRIEFLRKRRACIVIQCHLRGIFAREVWIIIGTTYLNTIHFSYLWVNMQFIRFIFEKQVAAALREMRRVEEEMRKRERIEAERREREKELSEQQAEEERKAIEECERYVNFFLIFLFKIVLFIFQFW